MQAIAVDRGSSTPRLVDLPRPTPEPGEALVRTLRVGVDGTDHEVLAGIHGGFPSGADRMVLGHEAVGVVEDANGASLSRGAVVVPTVRRRPNGGNEYFDRGEPDMAPAGQYVERGIDGADGFMAEYFTSPADCLVRVPARLAELAFLVEPISITEKALDLAYDARESFAWEPDSALVLGNGSLGLLTLAMLVDDYEDCYCLGRRDRPDPSIDLIEELGATYVDSRETPVREFGDVHGGADLVYEATGYARHAVDSVHALAPNGVAALLGVPDSWEFEFDGGAYHRELVLHNKAVVGSVNARERHFAAAVETLQSLSDSFLDDLVTGVYDVDDFERAFADDDTTIKTAIQFASHEER